MNRKRCAGLFCALLTLAVLVMYSPLRTKADNLYGSIRGTVTDQAAGSLPDASVTATNVATGVTYHVATSKDGSYNFLQLPVGDYTLKVEKSGFRTYIATKIHLDVNEVSSMDVKMALGAVTSEITVQANAAHVETSSIQLTSTISSDMITELPLIGRNWVTLQQTLPGVVTPDTRFGTNYSTNGSQAQQNSYLINGNDNNDLPLNSPQTLPNPDAIAEVTMVTNTINPEYGRNSGAIMNAITKSGSNQFHGDGFEFYRDSFLQTRNFFQTTPPPIHQNLFGGTIGGPIWKSKRMFFFYGIQLQRARVPGANSTGETTVFTGPQLGGDFSSTLGAAGCASPCNPISSNPSPFPVVGANGTTYAAGTPWSTIFPNANGIPSSDYNTTSTALIAKFVPGVNCNDTDFCFNPVTTTAANQHIGRFDWNVNSHDAVWFYAFSNSSSTLNDIPFSGSSLPGFGDGSTPTTKQFTAAWSHTFGSGMLNEFRVGYTRLNFPTGQPQDVRQPADVGFPNIFPELPSGADYPNIALTGYFTLGGTTNGPQPRIDQTYQATDNFSIVRGHHTFKFGYDGRKFQVWNPFAAVNDGAFAFTPSGFYSTGDAGLDFLLGIPTSYSQNSGSIIIADAYEHYLYGQDEWRARDNLTLTFGTGYQIDTPIAEYQNGGIARLCFQPGIQSTIFPLAPVGYTMTGDPGCTKYGSSRTKYNHFGPRVGFAYTPDWGWLTGGPGKTSIRAGFGMYFNRGEEELNLQDLGDPPFGLGTGGIGDVSTGTNILVPSFPNPWADIASGTTIPNKFPYVAPAASALGTTDFTPFEPMDLNTDSPTLTTPYAMNWNLTVERQLSSNFLLRVAYVAAHGGHLITSYTFNPATTAGVATCLANPACVDDRANATRDFPDDYPYPGNIWGNSGIENNGGWSNYNSLQVTLEKHLSHGLLFQSSYTWSHALDVSSSYEDTAFQGGGGVDPYGNFGRDYGNSAFDARSRFVASFSYELPDVSKKMGWNSFVASRFFGGWRLTGFNAMQSGFPILFQDTNSNSLVCSEGQTFYACPDRPDLVSMPAALNPRTATFGTKNHYYFDPSSMTDNAIGTLGSVPRGFFDGPGFWNADFSVQKVTKITEGTSFEMRLEAFNLFNHTNFANPSGNVASGNFGRISAIRANTNSRLVQLGAKFYF